ncbi:glycosyltransferase family A protein [Psychromarinibacter sp. C21-152]|uniref:Glycosyltransferase family A protein n=1 Tax=Psychromarinibacter sediminicola TaxID=3033385 RepID=A0AAE3T8L0_9RHOB|nr:glycosyltransferase family A protein [Psychromarinibacter sediminicola]MDF0601535.1 glycosyltransferase family A protein [Psychromarinibacter sediminicola]
MRIITLTTIPPRFDRIGPTLRSLLRQDSPADEVHLYIPRHYRRFPDYDGRLPDVPEGITIKRPEADFGPASKVLHAVRAYRGTPVEILFCDDDRLYRPDWTMAFFEARSHVPDAAIAPISWAADELFTSDQRDRPQPQAIRANKPLDLPYQAKHAVWSLAALFGYRGEAPSHAHIRTAGYRDIFQGYGGVMVRPDFFDDDVFDIPPVLWSVDDIWLSGMLAKAGTPIWAPARIKGPRLLSAHAEAPLYQAVLDGADRRTADRRCFDYMRKTYGVWP